MKFMTIKEYRAQLAQQAQEAAPLAAPSVSPSMAEKTPPAPAFAVLSREDARAQGLKRYYTGVPCVKGHDAERYTRDGRCVQCATAHSYEKYKRKMEADPEGVRAAIRESGRRHYERNREKVLDKKRASYQAKKAQRAEAAH
jgi:hypothetical protein